jgi:hypothetical protein
VASSGTSCKKQKKEKKCTKAEEGEVRGLREAGESQQVQKGRLQVEEEQGGVPRQEVGVGP